MQKQKNDKIFLKLAQLLANSDISSSLSEEYIKLILLKEGSINYQIPIDTVLGSTKPELLGCTLLHIAYKQNKLDLFKLLLRHGADFKIKNQKGNTVLHEIIKDVYADEAKSFELKAISDNPFVTSILNTLVESGNPRDSRNEKGITHFHVACMANHTAAVELFLKNDVFYNECVVKDSPIFAEYNAVHFAARFSNLDTIKLLLKCGAAHNIKTSKGLTPLLLLLQRNIEIADLLNKNEVKNAEQLISQRKINEDIIHLLLSKIDGQPKIIDDSNLTRLHVACIMESMELTEDVLGSFTYLNQSVSDKSSVFPSYTALHFAALCNVDKVKLLLERGANIHFLNENKQSPFDLCIERYKVKDIYDIIASQQDWSKIKLSVYGKNLLDLVSCMENYDLSSFKIHDSYVNPRIHKNASLWPEYNLLHVAVMFSERNCKNDNMVIENFNHVEILTSDSVTDRGMSPLHLAFRAKKAKVVKFLLTSHFSDTNLVDALKLSHLHIACAAGVTTAVEKLLLTSADVNAPLQGNVEWYRHPQSLVDNANLSQEVFIPKGATPLHVAVIVGNCDTMKLLLDHGADIYAQDEYGMTPIHWLIVSDNPISPAADILLSTINPVSSTSPANVNKRVATISTLTECPTKDGLSHLHVACFANNKDVVDQLIKNGVTFERINAKSFRHPDDDMKRFPGKLRYAGYTPIHFALEGKRDKDLIYKLIGCGAQILIKNPRTNSIPLYEAFNEKVSPCSTLLISYFKRHEGLKKRVERDVGLTMLHFYCCVLEYDNTENVLNDGAFDVNATMLGNSPIWPGYTPLHVFINSYQTARYNVDPLLKLLLDYGANVTALSAEMKTPLHMAYDMNIETSSKSAVLKSLLKSQKNFTINPQNSQGLSHFHIACALCDIVTIEKFLKRNADVNQAIDYFCEDKTLSGSTPLHLVLFHPLNQEVDVAIKLKAVNALIQHGANVKIENLNGDTALHIAAKYHSKEILEKIVDAGADIYSKNVLAQTPFEIKLSSKDLTVADVKFFLERGYPANSFNPITQKGFIAMTCSSQCISTFEKQKPAFDFMMKTCGISLDENGRTIIHNIVSTSTPVFADVFYIKIIELLVKIVNIDQQDNLGRTALHIATQFRNHRAVFALLQSGADINIIDKNNKTAFLYAFETSPFFEGSQDDSENIVKIFSLYVQKLNVCQLEVIEMNHIALSDAIRQYNVDVNVSTRFYDEIKQLKNLKIMSSTVTLQNFISGTNDPSVNERISQLKRKVIDNLYEKVDKDRFWESLGLIRLQCRRISETIVDQ